MENTKEFARQWIEQGKPCIYRYGWAYRGAKARTISQSEAEALLPKYSFGTGFYELSFTQVNGKDVLEFNELSENDML